MKTNTKKTTKEKTYASTIDIEPRWTDLLAGVKSGHFKPEVLEPACKVVDFIRQNQKEGKATMIDEKGNVEVI